MTNRRVIIEFTYSPERASDAESALAARSRYAAFGAPEAAPGLNKAAIPARPVRLSGQEDLGGSIHGR